MAEIDCKFSFTRVWHWHFGAFVLDPVLLGRGPTFNGLVVLVGSRSVLNGFRGVGKTGPKPELFVNGLGPFGTMLTGPGLRGNVGPTVNVGKVGPNLLGLFTVKGCVGVGKVGAKLKFVFLSIVGVGNVGPNSPPTKYISIKHE